MKLWAAKRTDKRAAVLGEMAGAFGADHRLAMLPKCTVLRI